MEPDRAAMAIRRNTVLIVVAILFAALLFAVPALINVDRYRAQVISYLQQKTGKQVEIGRLGLTFFPLSIQVDAFGEKNPPLFPPAYAVTLARLDTLLDPPSLLPPPTPLNSL